MATTWGDGRVGHRGPARIFSDEDCQRLAREYVAGASTPQLARRYHVGRSTIGRALRRVGQPSIPQRKFDADTRAAIAQDIAAGIPTREVARRYGCSTSHARDIAYEHGVRLYRRQPTFYAPIRPLAGLTYDGSTHAAIRNQLTALHDPARYHARLADDVARSRARYLADVAGDSQQDAAA